MDVDGLLADPPSLHTDGAGWATSYSLPDAALRLLGRLVGPGSRTLETGNGVSTLVFALRGARHTCVTPDVASVERIRAWCAERGVSLAGVEVEVGPSQDVLPRPSA